MWDLVVSFFGKLDYQGTKKPTSVFIIEAQMIQNIIR